MKKALSLLLAVMLVIGMVPVTFASDAPPATGYTYVFSNAAHTGSSDKANIESGGTLCKFEDNSGNRGLHTVDTTVESVSAPWGYVAQSFPKKVIGIGSDSSCMRLSFNRPDKKTDAVITFDPESANAATALCLELSVENGGTFIPAFSYAAYAASGPVVELYLVPKSGNALTNDTLSDFVKSLDAKYRIGIADTSTGKSETFRPITLSAGNYYFIIVPNGNGKENDGTKYFYYCQPQSLELLPIQKTYTYDFTTNVLSTENAKAVNDAIIDEGNSQDALAFQLLKSPTVDTTKTTEWKFRFSRYVYNKLTDEYCSNISENGLKMYLYTTRYYDKTATANNHTVGIATHAIFELSVPQAGTYKLKMYNTSADTHGGRTEVNFGLSDGKKSYLWSDADALYEKATNQKLGEHDSSIVHDGTATYPAEEFEIKVDVAGTYYVLFATPIEVTKKNSTKVNNYYQTLNLSKIVLEEIVDENAEYPGDEEINVNPDNAVTDSEKAVISNEMSVIAADTDGESVDAEIITTATSVVAPEIVGDYEFLYWAKGIGKNKKIVSHDAAYNFTKESEKLWLTAVYSNIKNAVLNATFYNANGEILKTVAISDGKVITPSLENVSLAGYGKATGWKSAGDETVYAANAEVAVSENALFVAEYDELDTYFDITVVNGSKTVEGGKEKPQFGDRVTVTAPLRKDNTKLFNYWKKGEEIVSFDKTYEFCAWEDATLTAVYSDYVPVADSVRKIILGSVTNGVKKTFVAEFIGFDSADVLERGIAFATSGSEASFASINRVIMNSKELNHLSAIDDIDASDVVGYVIDKEGNVYYSK